MGQVLSLKQEFKDVRLTPLSAIHLRELSKEARVRVEQEMERLRKLGPMQIYREFIAHRPIGFVDGVKSVGIFLVDSVLAIVEVLKKRLQLVAALDLSWLKNRRPDELITLWRRERLHHGHLWRAQILLDRFNHFLFVQVVCKTADMRLRNRRIKAWGYRLVWDQEEIVGGAAWLKEFASTASLSSKAFNTEECLNFETACAAIKSLTIKFASA